MIMTVLRILIAITAIVAIVIGAMPQWGVISLAIFGQLNLIVEIIISRLEEK